MHPRSAKPDAGSHILTGSRRGDVGRRHRGRQPARRPEHIRHPGPRGARGEGVRPHASAARLLVRAARAARSTRWSARTARGKSTLVKILSGVHAPDAGRVELAGERGSARADPTRGAGPRASSPSSRRSSSPRPARCSTTSGSAPTTRGGPGSPAGRSGARRSAGARRAARRAARPRHPVEELSLSRPPGLRHRAGPAAPAARS